MIVYLSFQTPGDDLILRSSCFFDEFPQLPQEHFLCFFDFLLIEPIDEEIIPQEIQTQQHLHRTVHIAGVAKVFESTNRHFGLPLALILLIVFAIKGLFT